MIELELYWSYKFLNIYFKQKCNGVYGNLWSWTKSNYIPYDGYKPYSGNLGEYNQKFMCNQFVLIYSMTFVQGGKLHESTIYLLIRSLFLPNFLNLINQIQSGYLYF